MLIITKNQLNLLAVAMHERFLKDLSNNLKTQGLPANTNTLHALINEATDFGLDTEEALSIYVESILKLKALGCDLEKVKSFSASNLIDQDRKLISLRTLVSTLEAISNHQKTGR